MSNTSVARPADSTAFKRRHSHTLLHVLMFVATFFWASNIIAGKEALRGFSPMALAQLRVSGAAVIYWSVLIGARPGRALRAGLRHWKMVVLLALNGATLNQLFFIGGLARTSVAHTALIVALGPVIVLVLSCLMRLELLTVLKFAGMLVSFAGVGVLTAGKSSDGSHWIGDLIVLGGTAVFAYYTILMKETGEQFDVLTVNALTFGLGALLMLPVSTTSLLAARWRGLPAEAWWGLAFMIVFGTVIPYVLFAIALSGLSPSRVAAFNYLQPVIATSLGIWLLSERLTTAAVVGGSLILLGVYLTERERGEDKEPERLTSSSQGNCAVAASDTHEPIK